MAEDQTEDSRVEFVLYVAGELPNSQRALSNLQAFCRDELMTEFRIEILDVFKQPERALTDKILITPQLVVRRTGCRQVIIGDLTDRNILRRAVGS